MGRWSPSARAAAILACSLVIYIPALGGGYLWDDQLYVTGNLALRSLAGLGDIWRIPPTTRQYYPLTFTSFWAEYQLWGDAPLGYHATNLILHAVNALLVWRLLTALEVPGAFLAACLFAVHPVHVESVAWIAERKNVLSGLFALLAALSWVRFLADRRPRSLVVTAAAFTCALLSKTQVCGLPVVLLLLAWWKQPDRWRRFVPPLVPLAILSVAAAVVTVASEHSSARQALPLPALHAPERVLVAGRALWFYAGTLLWPAHLVAVYGHWPVDSGAYAPYAFPLAAAAVLIVLWRGRQRLGRGPCVAVIAFIACLAPVLGFVDFNFMRFAFVADHFQYLASIPLIALGVAAAFAARVAPAAWLAPAGAAAVVLVLAATSWRRAEVHRDEESLWRDNIEHNPGCAAGYNQLGSVLLAQRRLDEASAYFAAATQIDPRFADAHNNWGIALKDQGRLDEAVAQYAEALRINAGDPVVHNNLGVVLHMQGARDEAIRHFAAAVQLDPSYAEAYDNWGAALAAAGDPAAAVEQYAAALRASPTDAAAHDNWGVALLALGRPEEAVAHFAAAAALDRGSYDAEEHWGEALQQLGRDEAAVQHHRAAARLDPSRAVAHRALGAALLNLGRADEARAELAMVVTMSPDSADAHHQLGVALGMTSRLDEALAHLATAARLAPDDADIQNHWGVALALAGRLDDAIARFREAMRLRPDDADARNNLARVLAQRDATSRDGRPLRAD